MVIILAHHYDREASWLLHSISESDEDIATRLLIPEALGIDYEISMNITKDECNASIYYFNNDERIASDDIVLVLNRLSNIDPIIWKKADEKDKEYASSEINAFFSAFIQSLKGKVINEIEYGSLYTNIELIKSLAVAMDNRTIRINSRLIEGDWYSQKWIEENIDKLIRVAAVGNKCFFPLNQNTGRFDKTIDRWVNAFQKNGLLELFLKPGNDFIELVYVTKFLSFSYYGESMLPYLIGFLNRHST